MKYLMFFLLSTNFAQAAFECPKTYDLYKDEIVKLNDKALAEAAKPDAAELLYKKTEEGELITLLAAGNIENTGGTISGFAIRCWSHYYEFIASMTKDSWKSETKKREGILTKWESCFHNIDTGKSLAEDIVACHRKLSRAK